MGLNALTESSPKLPRRYVVLGVVGILILASLVLWSWYVPGYGAGVDEASCLLGAKGLATRIDPAYTSPDPTLFVPENMIESRPGVFYPTYPIGYPLLAAVGYRLGGPEGAFVVNPVLTLAALLGAFFLARLFLDDLFALAATLVLGAHPSVLHYGVAAMSHASDLACAT
jgi:4-amino-4-deoxy-L-arabinose transferase-like glycosyltransferase